MLLSDAPGVEVPTNGSLGDNPLDDSPSCELLGPTALVVQALMGIFVILSLMYKRHREKPMRPWRIWLFDVSKQVVGQMFVHGVNVLISDITSQITDGNACVFYFLNILIDTTLGVALIYGVLHCLTWLLSGKLGLKGFESGVYGSPPSFNYWCRQAAIYVVSLTTMKFIVIALFIIIPGIFAMGEWFLSWTGNGTKLQVVFTMGLFPITMNVLQFWLIDSIVKASSSGSPVALDENGRDPLSDGDREPLFNAPFDDDDDDDDNNPYRPGDIESRLTSKPSRSSFDSAHSRSHATEITIPDSDGYKSFDNLHKTQERHSYPPSLSSSFGSVSASPDSKSGKSKQAARQKPHSLARSQSHDPTTSQASSSQHEVKKQKGRSKTADPAPPPEHPAGENDEWAVSWNEDDDWGTDEPVQPLQHEESRTGEPKSPARTRRLS